MHNWIITGRDKGVAMSLSLFTHTRTRTFWLLCCGTTFELILSHSNFTAYTVQNKLVVAQALLSIKWIAFSSGLQFSSGCVCEPQCTINLVEAAEPVAVRRQPFDIVSQSVEAVTQHKSLFNSIWLLIAFRLAYKRLVSSRCCGCCCCCYCNCCCCQLTIDL